MTPHGLWWHSIEVGEGVLALARAIPTYASLLSTDVLVLGALLHDIGKTREYFVVPGVGILRSPVATARYHTTLGIEIVTAAVHQHRGTLDAAAVPQWLIDAVTHVIESHHSRPEWGSPSAPASREAWLLHLADMTSATLQSMTAALDGASSLDLECWYRPLETRSRLVLCYPPNSPALWVPTPEATSRPPGGAPAPQQGSIAAAQSTVSTTPSTAGEIHTGGDCTVLMFRGARKAPSEIPPRSDEVLRDYGPSLPELASPGAIGLPVPAKSASGRNDISVHAQDLRLLVLAGLTVLTRSSDEMESRQRLKAIGRVLMDALDSQAQAAVRSSMRALRVAGGLISSRGRSDLPT